jgi:DNA polymerase
VDHGKLTVRNLTVREELELLCRELSVEGVPMALTAKKVAAAPTDTGEFSGLNLDALREVALGCTRCRLCETRTNVVFGTGKSESPLICFIGEGPGAEEDKRGEPFVGRAGQLLTDAIEKGLKLSRSDVYICNVVKCRPPENRTPLVDEMQACSQFLYRQIELVKPKVIITLGQPAQLATTGIDLGITKLRGRWQSWRGFPLMPTLHPAYLLRNPSAKKDFWEDLKSVMEFLGI